MKSYAFLLIILQQLRLTTGYLIEDDEQYSASEIENQYIVTNLYFKIDENIELQKLIHIIIDDLNYIRIFIFYNELKKNFGYGLFLNEDLQAFQIFRYSVYESIYIVYNNSELYFIWYSAFNLCYQQQFVVQTLYLSTYYQIWMTKTKFLVDKVSDVEIFQTHLEKKLNHYFIQFNYQINYLQSLSFVSNYSHLQFWIRNKQKNNFELLLSSQNLTILFMVEKELFVFQISQDLNYTDQINLQWNLINIQLLFDKNFGIYQRLSNKQVQSNFNFNVSENWGIQASFIEIKKSNDVEFTGVQVHFRQEQLKILCIPGCSECSESGFCLKCNQNLILLNGICECDDDSQYYYEYSECYNPIKLYQSLEIKQKNCATFNGQLCPQCESDQHLDYEYCIYEIQSKFTRVFYFQEQQDGIYFEESQDQLVIFNDNSKNLDDFNQLNEFKFKLYTLYYNSRYYNVFANQEEINNCFKNFSGKFCETKNIKKCTYQSKKFCLKCEQNYFLDNQLKCSRCPQNCMICNYDNKQIICMKCVNQYFLNFQGQCQLCELQYCKVCYQYDQKEQTIEVGYQTRKSLSMKIGCSVCQQNYTLELEFRRCVNNITKYEIVEIQQRNYQYYSSEELKLYQCDIFIYYCQICQNNRCLLCEQYYYLDFLYNKCKKIKSKAVILNYDSKLDDLYIVENLLTYLYFDYHYENILDKQKSLYISKCPNPSLSQEYFICNDQSNQLKKDCGRNCRICDIWNQCLSYLQQILIIFQCQFDIMNKCKFEDQEYYFGQLELRHKENEYLLFSILTDRCDQLWLSDLNNKINLFEKQFYQKEICITILNQDCITLNNVTHLANFIFTNTSCININSNEKITLHKISFIGDQSENIDQILNLNIQSRKAIQINKMNVSFFNQIRIYLNAKMIDIYEVHLKNQFIVQNDPVFLIYSDIVTFFNLKISNCSFQSTIVFDIRLADVQKYYIYAEFIVIEVSNLTLNESLLINLKNLSKFTINMILFNDLILESSNLIQAHSMLCEIKNFLLQNAILINNSSVIFLYSKFHFGYIFLKKNYFDQIGGDGKGLIVIICAEQEIYINEIKIIYGNFTNEDYASQIQKFIPFILIQSKTLLIKTIIIQNFILYFIKFLDLEAENLIIKEFKLTDSIMASDDSQLIIIQSQKCYLSKIIIHKLLFAGKQFMKINSLSNINISNLQISSLNVQLQIIRIQNDFIIFQTYKLNLRYTLIYDSLVDKQQKQNKDYQTNLFVINSNDAVLHYVKMRNDSLNGYSSIILFEGYQINCFNIIIQQINLNKFLDIKSISIKIKTIYISDSIFDDYVFVFKDIFGIIQLEQFKVYNQIPQNQLQGIFFAYSQHSLVENLLSQLFFDNLEIINQSYLQDIFVIQVEQVRMRIFFKNFIIENSQSSFISIRGRGLILLQMDKINVYLTQNYNESDWFLFNIDQIQSLIITNLYIQNHQKLVIQFHAFSIKISEFLIRNSKLYMLISNIDNEQKMISFITNMYLINNSLIYGELNFFLLFFQKNFRIINQLILFNNSVSSGFLLLLSDEYKLQKKFLDNFIILENTYNHKFICFDNLNYRLQNFIAFPNDNIFFTNQSINHQLQNSQITQKYQILLQVNNLLFQSQNYEDRIKKYLLIPSGQRLKDYQIFNHHNLQYFQYIQDIKVVSIQNEKFYQISERFIINTFKYYVDNMSIGENLTQYQNIYQFNQNESTSDLREFKLSYNPDLQDMILIQITPENITYYSQLQIFTKMQQCQIGEIKFKNQCLRCDLRFNLYSVKQKSNYCSLFDHEIGLDFKSGAINLRQGFWRPYVYSHKIEKCEQNTDVCKGGWYTGDDSCQVGNLGGICQSCDTQNVRGDGYFKMRDNQCIICAEFNYLYFIIQFSIILAIYTIQLYIKNENNLLLYKRFILMKLVNSRVFQTLQIYLIDMSSALLQILIQNFALLYIIFKDINYIIPDVMLIFTNPFYQIQNSKICYQKLTNMQTNYIEVILKLIFPIIIYNTYIMLIQLFNRTQHISKQYFIYPLIQIMIFQCPQLLLIISQQFSLKQLSNINYYQFDHSIRFYSQNHQKFIKHIIPIVILLGILIPLLLIKVLTNVKKSMFKNKFFLVYGSITQPYKIIYQEIINNYKNFIYLFLLNGNQNMFLDNLNIYIIVLLIHVEMFFKAYKIELINKLQQIQKQLFFFIIILVLLIRLEKQIIKIIIMSIYFAISIKQYIKLLFFKNKDLIFQYLQNVKFISKILHLNEYQNAHKQWLKLKQHHKFIVQNNRTEYQFKQILHSSQSELDKSQILSVEPILSQIKREPLVSQVIEMQQF